MRFVKDALLVVVSLALCVIVAEGVVRARKALRSDLQRSCRTCADHGCLDCSCGVRVSR